VTGTRTPDRLGAISPQDETDTDVLIIGAGPVGLSLALSLARQGVRSIILERHREIFAHPRAHFVNTRTMELFRLWGVADSVKKAAYPVEHLPFELMVPLGGISWEERQRISPETVMSCAQDKVEEALTDALHSFPDADVRRGHALIGFDDHGASVTARVAGAKSEEYVLSARWLVGADGAGSFVRESLGIGLIGDQNLASMVNIYFESRLHPEGVVPPLAMPALHPDVAGAFVCMDGDGRWCFHYSGEDLDLVADFDEASAATLIRRAADVPADHPLHVRSIRRWTMAAVVADRMRSGSIFLAGDAAHAFPPTGGLGMNSGIQDAHNLAWKLAAVCKGIGGELLLDSYEQERQPIAYLNTAQSLRNAHRDSSGENPSPFADEIEKRASTSVRSRIALASSSEERDVIEMLEHSVAIGLDLGFSYETSNVVLPDGTIRPDTWVDQYVPNAAPGSRAPHMFVTTGAGALLSTIDLFDGVFTLVTSGGGIAWEAAVALTPENLRPKVITIAPGEEFGPLGADLTELYGIDPTGAVLVRPDGHVAGRFLRAPEDVGQGLDEALRKVYGIPDRE